MNSAIKVTGFQTLTKCFTLDDAKTNYISFMWGYPHACCTCRLLYRLCFDLFSIIWSHLTRKPPGHTHTHTYRYMQQARPFPCCAQIIMSGVWSCGTSVRRHVATSVHVCSLAVTLRHNPRPEQSRSVSCNARTWRGWLVGRCGLAFAE